MKERDSKVAERFKSLVSQRVSVYEMLVFGSRSREEGSSDSDLDVLVVVEVLNHETERYISECAWEAGFPDDVVVVPITISKESLEKSPIRQSAFIKNVYREGISI